MSKLTRKTFLQFGSTVNAGSEIGQFGSYASPIYSADPDVLQAGTAWPRGWFAETIATNRPFIQDQNSIDFVFSYMIATILQMGISEYDAGTTYYTNSVVQVAGQIYISKTDSNTGNTPASSSSNWQPGLPGSELTGVMKPYVGTVAPTGYLLCDGSAVSRSTYAALFALCGTNYGAGNGTTTFNLPDMRTRVPVGYKSGDSDFGTMGATGGEKTHTLTTAEVPALSASIPRNIANASFGNSALASSNGGADSSISVSTSGDGGAHNNLQPFQVFNYIIKT